MNGVYTTEQLKSYVQTYGDKTYYSVASFFGLGISYAGNSYGEEMIKKIAEINATPKRCPLPTKIQKQDPALQQEIIDKTQFLDIAFANGDIKPKTGRILMMQRLYCVVNDIREIPKCGQCPKLLANFFVDAFTHVHTEFCSVGCTQRSPKTIARRLKSFCSRSPEEKAKTKAKFEKTCKEKFGEACFMKSQYFKDKQHEYIVENGGTNNVSQISFVRDKIDETNIEKFGNRCNLANEEQKLLKIQTYLDHYGATHPLKSEKGLKEFQDQCEAKTGYRMPGASPESRHKSLITNAKNHKIPFVLSNPFFTPLFDVEANVENLFTDKKQMWWQCNKCGHVFAATFKSFSHPDLMTICPFCSFDSKSYGHSKDEKAIAHLLMKAFPEVKICFMSKENRKIIAPKEIDIWLPDLKLGIEFDGVFWHSVETNDEKKEQNDIFAKTKLCEEKGIRLIHIYQDEWRDHPEQILRMLMHAILQIPEYPLNATDKYIFLPRDKYPPFYKIDGYHPLFCTRPTIKTRDKYFVFDCGELVFVRNDVELHPPANIKELLAVRGAQVIE